MVTTTNMSINHFVLDTGAAGNILKATMNQYNSRAIHRRSQLPGYILLFAHRTGFRPCWPAIICYINEQLRGAYNRELVGNDQANKSPTRVLEA